LEASPDEPKREDRELSREERERLRTAAANLRGISMPKFGLKVPGIVDMSAFAKVAADAAKLSSFSLPESTLNFLTGASGIAAQQSKFLDSLKPVLAAQRQFGQINSDFFKTHAATQAQFAKFGANLTKTIDFGASLTKFAQQFAAQQTSLLQTLGPTLELLRKSFYPPNLRGIEDLAFEDVEKVIMADAIALYGVPQTSIAKALICAESAAKRREILGRRWKAISEGCRKTVEGLKSETVEPYARFALAALDALDNCHTEAAQALAGSLIDSLLTAYFGKDRYKYTPAKNGKRTTEAYEEFTIHQFIAFAPMWQVYQQFWVQNGDRIPTNFSRNATAHAVSARQFNRRNAVQALLFATSLLFFFDEQASRRKGA
jgi:hypothetical protein